MGLDVYLYRYNNREETERLESEYEKVSSANWPDDVEYKALSEEQKENIRTKNKEFAKSIGLDEHGNHPDKKCIEFNCPDFPEHYFKIGYFISSYNGGGINNVLRNLNLSGLYEIFDRKDDDAYVFQPNWESVRIRLIDVIGKFKDVPNLRCYHVGWNEFKGNPNTAKITNDKEALSAFIEESKKWTERKKDGGYSNSEGEFHPNGIKVFGLISGVDKRFFVDEKLPCTYVIIEGENEWYLQALEIVKQTIDYVLAQPDKDKYYLHWSS